MATKTVTIVTCDLPHAREVPGVQQVTIDVCDKHLALLAPQSNGDDLAAKRERKRAQRRESERRRRQRAQQTDGTAAVNGFSLVPQTCDDCGRTFKSQQALTMHQTLAAKRGSHETTHVTADGQPR